MTPRWHDIAVMALSRPSPAAAVPWGMMYRWSARVRRPLDSPEAVAMGDTTGWEHPCGSGSGMAIYVRGTTNYTMVEVRDGRALGSDNSDSTCLASDGHEWKDRAFLGAAQLSITGPASLVNLRRYR